MQVDTFSQYCHLSDFSRKDVEGFVCPGFSVPHFVFKVSLDEMKEGGNGMHDDRNIGEHDWLLGSMEVLMTCN